MITLQIPNDKPSVDATGADLADVVRGPGILANRADGVLVDRLQLRVILGLSFEIHLSEHVEGRFLGAILLATLGRSVERTDEGPARRRAAESERLAVL